MPGRLIPLVNDEVYHVVNRGIDHRPTFLGIRESSRALETIKFYKFKNPPLRLSFFFKKSTDEQVRIMKQLKEKAKYLVDIFCFCLMPNHFHFLLKQKLDNGIAKFMANFQNSYTRYFNTKNKRKGPLFYDQFRAVRIETDEQLLHVSRYIHLNPYSSFVVKKLKDAVNYPWSSITEYLEDNIEKICEIETIMSFFKTEKSYYKFIADRADYQRELETIKHLALEN